MEPTYDAFRVVSLSPWPIWALVLLALCALAGVVLAAYGLRREPRALRRRLLIALRLGAMLAALFVVLEPGLRLLQTARVKNRLAVLVDSSASMAFPARAGGASRAETARMYLEQVAPSLEALREDYTIETYRFDGTLQAGTSDGAPPQGTRTDVLGALRALAQSGSGRKLAGALVVSDGADNVELRGGLTGAAKEAVTSLSIPIATVAVAEGAPRDVALVKLKVDDFAFVRNTVEIEAELHAEGMGQLEIPVVLRREGQVLAQQTVRVTPSERSYPLRFSFVPDQIGEFAFSIGAPAYEGEAVHTNNSRSFVLRVIRDRVRTLLVVGRPSWDERFLRMLLKQDPNVDLISFFILRTPQDQPKAQEHEISLIPFPTDEIFDKQLASFDLVIFQNFAFRPYRMEHFLPNIRRYVEEGGAFAMIGGENSFGEGGYQASPIGELLPVESVGQPPTEELFAPRLTAQGLRHPVTQLRTGGEANQRAFSELPQLPGVNVTRAKPTARVLLDHPHLVIDGAPAPVLAVGDFGRGRVLALTTDASWYWSLVAAGRGTGSSRAYDRIWANAIRWLVRDPELTPVRIEVEEDELEPGGKLVASVIARRADYGPAEGSTIAVTLQEADSGRTLEERSLVAGADGTARLELPAPAPGAYKLRAKAMLGGLLLGEGEDALAVRAASAEASDPKPRPELLRQLADATGAGFVEASSGELPKLALAKPEVVEVGRSKDDPLWDRWWSLAALAFFLTAEWLLRRRFGYA